VVGVLRPRESKLRGDAKWRSGMPTPRKVLVLLLAEEAIGSKRTTRVLMLRIKD
jgi:hypothetical protein